MDIDATKADRRLPSDGAQLADRGDRVLALAITFFAIAVLLHNSDHVRRGGGSVGLDVFWAGSSAIVLEVGIVALVLARHRLAPLAAAVTGASLAVGYVVVHFLPERGWLSDSFTSGGDVSRLSWSAASLEVVAATTLAAAGIVVLRRRGGLASAAKPTRDQVPLFEVARHPVVVVMALGNAAIFAISVAQL